MTPNQTNSTITLELFGESQADTTDASRLLCVSLKRKTSITGIWSYNYMQSGIHLPDGLNTHLRLDGKTISMSAIGRSKNSKNAGRKGVAEIVIDGSVYKVTAYLKEGKKPYYVEVVARKKLVQSKPKQQENIQKKKKKKPRTFYANANHPDIKDLPDSTHRKKWSPLIYTAGFENNRSRH